MSEREQAASMAGGSVESSMIGSVLAVASEVRGAAQPKHSGGDT